MREKMTIATENQAVIRIHGWQGIASSIIGVTSIIFNLLLVGIAVTGTAPSRPMTAALSALAVAMLCASMVGIVLGFWGANERSSRKLYPLLGLTLNVAILTTLVALAIVGLSMNAH